jgi:hypothetical protein
MLPMVGDVKSTVASYVTSTLLVEPKQQATLAFLTVGSTAVGPVLPTLSVFSLGPLALNPSWRSKDVGSGGAVATASSEPSCTPISCSVTWRCPSSTGFLAFRLRRYVGSVATRTSKPATRAIWRIPVNVYPLVSTCRAAFLNCSLSNRIGTWGCSLGFSSHCSSRSLLTALSMPSYNLVIRLFSPRCGCSASCRHGHHTRLPADRAARSMGSSTAAR